ncbi:MAG TPA: tetratricopeptide repeat protein [Rhizomicrobium sp.]|nr:tetratricopeptide repeat protein [Rhizomicrobium sp.]
MTALLLLIFLGLAAIAAGFACWPILRAKGSRAKALLAGAVALVVLGIGIGVYLMLGSPGLALRTLAGPGDNDLRGLIAQLSVKVRQSPNNPQGWMLLGRGYLTLGDGVDAAAAFKRALGLVPPDQRPTILSAYGEALTVASAGAVTPAAEAAFDEVLKSNPKDLAARYFLGLAYASRHDNAKAIAIWENLLADAPVNAPWRAALIDRLAGLKAQSGAGPDISAMVEGLAARLRLHANDPQGWQRLIRAYAVLGDKGKASAALAYARVAAKKDASVLSALDAEAKELQLQK